ncbi:FAD:protein FMN transferase [Horticoccus sp. 23ND18S-11]|uniref:FAD:protein FMN transferase n=1 Tax=Horticoccus sp. 23ND18S-11 TaxID=3391832 RepID=UPI0039C9A70D
MAASGLTAAESVSVSGRAMGTTWTVTWVQPETAVASAVIAGAVAERLEALEQIFSTYREQSELMRFNATQRADWLPVSPELAQLAAESRRISAVTDGAFDVTVQPLVVLWGFGPTRRTGALPTREEVNRARARVDWRQLEVQRAPPALRKGRVSVAADFSSMAKGFAADAVGDQLVFIGVGNHLVQVGGDVRARGGGIDGRGWSAAIEEPRDGPRAIATVVQLDGRALSTSGDYRNHFVQDGRRYGHIIDPRTGEPVNHDLAAVSVVHVSSALSSAWATALFVLGSDAGGRVALEQKIAALFFVREGSRIVRRPTPEFARSLP